MVNGLEISATLLFGDNKMRDFILGCSSFITTLTTVEITGANSWQGLLIALCSALIFAAVNIVSKIVTSQLEKKGIITHEDKEKIDETIKDGVEDIMDDGKLNDSNEDKKD